jgi:hypothetical protein
MTLSDMPQGSGNWLERRVELHGIKFEGDGVVNSRVFNNYVRIIQHLPDDEWDYVPATPLNIACYDANAMNEVFDNTIIALTEYSETQHGPYGESGQWAASIYFVGMDSGAASGDNYSVYIHDNEFTSNDLFVASGSAPNMTIRIENNTFTLADDPPPTTDRTDFRNIGAELEAAIEASNEFVE